MIDFENNAFNKLRKVNEDSVADEISPLFISGETLIGVYKGIRDYVAFTNTSHRSRMPKYRHFPLRRPGISTWTANWRSGSAD